MTTENAQVEERVLNGIAEDEDVVTPWTVTSVNDSGIDYDKLISKSRFLQEVIYDDYPCRFVNAKNR